MNSEELQQPSNPVPAPPQDTANQGYGQPMAQAPAPAPQSNTKKAVFWFLSPAIVLGAGFITALFSRVVPTAAFRTLLNIAAILLGMAGVIVVFMGPIVCIIILAKRKN